MRPEGERRRHPNAEVASTEKEPPAIPHPPSILSVERLVGVTRVIDAGRLPILTSGTTTNLTIGDGGGRTGPHCAPGAPRDSMCT
jgi:hypothetical protein